ncbi:MAG: hypothetical protein ACJKSS_00635 [Patescibacteria group bacterium UBA2103]
MMLISAIIAVSGAVSACGQQQSSVDAGGNIPAAAARGFMSASSIQAAEGHVGGTIINADGCFDRFPGEPALDQVMYLIEGEDGRIAVIAAHPFFVSEEGEAAEEVLFLFESREEWENSLKFALGWVESGGCSSVYTAEDGTITVVGYRPS